MPTPSATSSVPPANTAGSDSDADSVDQPARKRARRIALACNRCKSRKQRCNMEGRGPNDPCKSCEKAGADCVLQERPPKTEYPVEYISFLESRIASLEARLADLNPDDQLISDHLHEKNRRPPSDEELEGVAPEGEGKVKSEIAAGVALLSLNSASEPHYLGPSSGYSWAKTLLGTLHRPPKLLFQPKETFQPRYQSTNTFVCPSLPAKEVGAALLDSFYMHVQARYPFVDWRQLRGWLARQDEMVVQKGQFPINSAEGREKGTASFFIWMVYAIGARLLQGVPLPGVADPETYYTAALEHFDVIVTLHNVENVQAFLYLVMYSLRCTEGPSVWHLTGLAMKMCVEMGMHRRRRMPKSSTPYLEEVRKRVWWTVYGLDRWFALTLGRPLGIDDREVDQALPLDIMCDSDVTPGQGSTRAGSAPIESPLTVDHDAVPGRPLTSMSSSLHIIRLRRIEAQIQMSVYRVDTRLAQAKEEVKHLLDKIEKWREAIPKRPSGAAWASIPCCSEDWFIAKADAARLMLLRPFTSSAKPNDEYLVLCAQACATQCQTYRRLHQNYPLANSLSLTDLHTIFLTGLTLLHCLLTSPRVIPLRESSKAIRACSTSLFVYAQHFKAAEPFRDAFEDMANACLDACESAQESEEPVLPTETRDMQSEWERHVGEMAAWMMNANAQRDFLQLVTSLGFNPDLPLDLAQPAPQEHELVLAPQVPFQIPVFSGEPELYPSIQGVVEQQQHQHQHHFQQQQQQQQQQQLQMHGHGQTHESTTGQMQMLGGEAGLSQLDLTLGAAMQTPGQGQGASPFGDWFTQFAA
ncbi:fungal-specific transcription factor domain-domain-containing protein [Naematelia encephala]|uniref:Fungal-specific transcription factor domain-domain-containing protein n=1 Tax=Naematelia encephala TaxID=71784 RepID=A0A1Y2AS28_9TREE|nr:fungal-specific transcription factor domain-domain-containing protein [Naematelia encephala]